MDLKAFLETTPPFNKKKITGFEQKVKRDDVSGAFRIAVLEISLPEIHVYCDTDKCGGIRLFKSKKGSYISIFPNSTINNHSLDYICKNCGLGHKKYSILSKIVEQDFDPKNDIDIKMYFEKYGEYPRFGTRVPKGVLDLFGSNEDRENFLKGRQSEDKGYGIGAYSYYRRVVENKKDVLFEKIIEACRNSEIGEKEIKKFEEAKKKTQFSSAIEDIEDILPNSLYIKSHNPLTLLHKSLSKGIHNMSDQECLEQARYIRTILTNLIKRIDLILEQNKEFEEAINHLVGKGGREQ